MKKLTTSALLVLLMIFTSISNETYAQLQQDSKYGFKINIPPNWNKTNYLDGSDEVYDYMSPDENAAVQLRVFEAKPGFTTVLLAQVYEESMLPAGTQKLSLEEYITANGIPSKKGVYLLDYNGNEVGLSALYIVQNNKGYVLTALIPSSMIQQKGAELKKIIKSFMIDGFETPNNIVKEEKKSTGLGGLLGGTKQNNTSSTNTYFGNNEVTISGNGMNGTYKFVKGDCFPISWNKTTTIRGLNAENQLMLEIFLYNYKGTGKFSYASSNKGFRISTVNRVGVGGSDDSSTGELTITEYNVGGMIKGSFSATVNGRSIKGSFSLPLSLPKDNGGQ